LELSELRHKSLKCNGLNLHVTEAGPEDGPVVLMLHGFPEYWYCWRHQIKFFSEQGYRVIVPDQRGYNLSDKPRRVRDYRLDEIANDALALLDAADCQQAELLIGHDWGGAVAWHLAQNSPERFKRAAILNVPHFVTMRKKLLSSWTQLRKSWYMFFFQLPLFPEAALLRKNCARLKWLMRASSNPSTFSNEDLAQYADAWMQPDAMRSMLHWYRAAFRFPPKIKKEKIPIPLLLIWGMKDEALDSEMALPSLQHCENGRLVELPEATHWVQSDEPDAVNNLLRDLIRSEPASVESI
jgi:epoxide hydrolase 4